MMMTMTMTLTMPVMMERIILTSIASKKDMHTLSRTCNCIDRHNILVILN